MELKRNSNAVYLLNYHLILITKYRKKVFTNDIIVERTKEIMRNIASDFDCNIINQECGEDHIHLMISTKPTTDLTKLVNLLKGTSSRYIRKEFEYELSNVLYGDSFWSDSYYLATAGNVSVDITGKANGRGAYLKKDKEVINKAKTTKALERILEVTIPDSIYEEMLKLVD
jgi:putative transposase